MDLKTKIQSLQQSVDIAYTRPDPGKLAVMVESLRDSPGWDYLTKERGLSEETISTFSLGYDKEKNAIAIPHFKDGKLINIKYRFLEPKDVRYINESGAEPWMFNDTGIQEALSKQAIAIVEGEFDCMSLWQMGFKNVISPGMGANSFGVWIEHLDKIKQVWIAYDNDAPGQSAAKQMAERIGLEKCRNVKYPEEIKDGNELLLKKPEIIREVFAKAVPFFKYEFSGVADVVQKIIDDPVDYLEIPYLPNVKLERDQLVVLSGVTNGGKTSVSLNILKDLSDRNIPSLIMPFERGVYSVGRRYLQIALGKTQEDMQFTSKEEWGQILPTLVNKPVFFSVPDRHKINETIARAKRLFGVRVVIIDHLDYVIRNLNGNRENAISDTMQGLKRVAEETGVIIIVVTHVRKLDDPGSHSPRKPNLDDLKGSSSLKQDPEVVAMVHPTKDRCGIEVDIQKNKGPMTSKTFSVDMDTGVIGGEYNPDDF